ncbi:MAG: glycosyltransferase [Promethearchaeota archaeon]
MIIYFNENVRYTPWGGGIHFLADLICFLKERGHQITFKLKKKIDLIFIITNFRELNPKILKYLEKYPDTKVIQRINISDISKNVNYQDKLVLDINKIADETIFISKWLAEYYKKKGFNRSYHVIYNGCNRNYFFPKENKELGEKFNLVTHHWSNNWMKGFDIYTALDKILVNRKDIFFTYIGNYTDKYKSNNTKLISPLYGEKLGEELRKYDVYLTASRWEGCGMHHIEGASCGLPVLYHRDGGGLNEACKNYGIEFNDIDSLLDAIGKIKENYYYYRNKIDYNFLSAERCSKDYYNIILNTLDSN